MSIIKVENLTFSYPSGFKNIFENVNFQIDTDWKLGFIGRNGKGKTTFLNLLQGKYEYSGKIYSPVKFEYFPYPVPDKTLFVCDILYSVCPEAEDWQFMRELSELKIQPEILYRQFNTLSLGEQTKVLIAAMFLNDGKFLLIDEPTNHLDGKSRDTVSSYLKKKKGFILVSHDRKFLDGCVDHILSLNRQNIEIQKGNFSSWQTNFERQLQDEKTSNEKLQSEIKRLKESAARTSAWAEKTEASKYGKASSGLRQDKGFVGHKAAAMMKQAKNYQARQNKAIEIKSGLLKNAEAIEELKIHPLVYHSERLLSFNSVSAEYDGKPVCSPVTFEVKNGEKIAICGCNGCGKSSILKIASGLNTFYSGNFIKGSNLVISYVPQDTAYLKGSLKEFAQDKKIDENLLRAILNKMDFNKEEFLKDISEMSDGQKKKIQIAGSLCESAHLYIWDEPLNFIDIYSCIQIENLLKAFNPTMLFVEHDQVFRENIATKIIDL